MNLEQHANQDKMKVWLSQDEITELLDSCTTTTERIIIGLAVRSGLRSHEILQVAPKHVHSTDAGTMLRVWHGKGDKYRETPIPDSITASIMAIHDMRNQPDTDAVINITTTRSLRRTLKRVVEKIESDDPGWQHLSMHDLRRTWATQLHGSDVDPLVVMEWGGWNDLETFLDHYKGTSTPEAQARERQKVTWL